MVVVVVGSRHSRELNAFFKVELNFVQNPPGGPPLLKAISSQNECGSTIGLALISIHLACLCAEPAGGCSWRLESEGGACERVRGHNGRCGKADGSIWRRNEV